MNYKNARIAKLLRKGQTPEQIAAHLGMPLTPELWERIFKVKAEKEKGEAD